VAREDARTALVLYAARQLGRPYIWADLDCSGFVVECLSQVARSWPGLYDGTDRSSQGLFDYFLLPRGMVVRSSILKVEDLRPGMLVFYYDTSSNGQERVFHVAIHAMTVPPFAAESGTGAQEVGPVSIEAGGGGSANVTPRASLIRPAGVRFAASDRHGSASWKALDPFVLLEG